MAVDKKDIESLRASLPDGRRAAAARTAAAKAEATAITNAKTIQEWRTGKNKRIQALVWVGTVAVLGIIVISVLGRWH